MTTIVSSLLNSRDNAQNNVDAAWVALEKAYKEREEAGRKYYDAIVAALPTSPAEALSAHQIALRLAATESDVNRVRATITNSYIGQCSHPDSLSMPHLAFEGLKKTKKTVTRRWVEVDEEGNLIGPVHEENHYRNVYYIEK